jgi:hypothetical protein
MGRKKRKKGEAKLRRSKVAKRVRRSAEFDPDHLLAKLAAPRDTGLRSSWTLTQIREAREAQLQGQFYLPARAAAAMRADDALYAAYDNRLAPLRALDVRVTPSSESVAAKKVANEARALFGRDGFAIRSDTLSDINGDLANHGVAVGYLDHHVRDDGSRIDLELHSWPLEFVRWDHTRQCLMTRVDQQTDTKALSHQTSGSEVPIVHGDGRWVVFQNHERDPWAQNACILSALMVWARHAYAIRDWAKASVSHGNAKIVGEMPQGIALEDADGNLTDEAHAFLKLLTYMASADSPVGIKPSGGALDYIVNNSTAWQVWAELVKNAEKAAARIYLGTDGMLGSVGGAPGVDLQALFGVATTKVQADVGAIDRGINTGVIPCWAAINFGDSRLAPRRESVLPDGDAAAERKLLAENIDAFNRSVAKMRANKFVIDQPLVAMLADRFGVPAPALDTAPAQGDVA